LALLDHVTIMESLLIMW